MITVCEICNSTIKEVNKFVGFVCDNCDQEYLYDNDCYRISLSDEQIKILKEAKGEKQDG